MWYRTYEYTFSGIFNTNYYWNCYYNSLNNKCDAVILLGQILLDNSIYANHDGVKPWQKYAIYAL